MNYEKFKLVLVKHDNSTSSEAEANEAATTLSKIPAVAAVAVPKSLDYEIIDVEAAPVRRVFTVDTGDMPPARAQECIAKLKEEIQNRPVPTVLTEDFFVGIQSGRKFNGVEIIR